MSYENWCNDRSPSWLRGDFIGQLGAEKDRLADRIRQGILARFPISGPADALPQIAADRRLFQGLAESEDQYRERLRVARDAWGLAGNHDQMLRQLWLAGYQDVAIVQFNGIYSYLDGTESVYGGTQQFGDLGFVPERNHNGWVFDLSNTFWSKFGVIFGGLSGQTSLLRWQHSTKAVFDGSTDEVAITWDNPFDDALWLFTTSVSTSDDTIPLVTLASKTKGGAIVTASSPFEGEVHILAWSSTSANPFIDPTLAQLTFIRQIIKDWKPGWMTADFIAGLLEGRLWGWPVQTWGDNGLWLGTSVTFEGVK